MHFIKLDKGIVDSTIWNEPTPTRIVWITMLAKADWHGFVATSIPGLANVAGVTIKECHAAINCFLSPDPYSRSTEYEGRRIGEADGGYVILNFAKYRDRRFNRKEYMKEYMKDYRKRKKFTGEVNDSGNIEENSKEKKSNTFNKPLAKTNAATTKPNEVLPDKDIDKDQDQETKDIDVDKDKNKEKDPCDKKASRLLVLVLKLDEILNQHFKITTPSEISTFSRLAKHVTTTLVDQQKTDQQIIDQFLECISLCKQPNIDHPNKMMVALCKERYQFKSQAEKVLNK
jgi:hypothetical protein